MRIYLRFRDLEASELLREHARHRVRLQLGRFGREIGSVSVRLSDLNGPRGGDDKRCHVELRGPTFGVISIDERSGDALSAIDLAVERAAHSAGRELDRARPGRRGPVALRAS